MSGLGAVLLQIQDDGSRRPVSYISRAVTDAEKNYAVIEKEALAATWASERFSEYILGKQYTLETDQKPLVPLLSAKELHKMPSRIQRFRMRLMRFSPNVLHVLGKHQITADALSRAPTNLPSDAESLFVDEVADFAQQAIDSLPASPQRLQNMVSQQKRDSETRILCSLSRYQTGLGLDWPWMFDVKRQAYIVMVDYYSRWVELRLLKKPNSVFVINKLKSIFVTHGIPEAVVSDSGPQFSSASFQAFAKEFTFIQIASSPRYPQSNGEAERAGQTVKLLLKKANDPHTTLLLYRATPLQNGYTPSELLMGRRLQTKVPIMQDNLHPSSVDLPCIRQREEKRKEVIRLQYNKRHSVKSLPELRPGDSVHIRDLGRPGIVDNRHPNPRYYTVTTEKGSTVRCNRSHLVATPEPTTTPEPGDNTPSSTRHPDTPSPARESAQMPVAPTETPHVSRYRREIRVPTRLDL
ncbi:uncharacterized protein LOC106012495 [Aplysia californica]|uniref:Uncharacterized protein LOC106012495 n=1 Tax=Aplysia californica TaxID=6500 RepID=A0ABM1A580_APLCA|nr:uncharacterized protein LOC106012495 [Aplysia californica]